MDKMPLLLVICALYFSLANGLSGLFSVTFDVATKTWSLSPGKAQNYVATAQVQSDMNLTGWATLDIVTNGAQEDYLQAFGAGYIEGALTTDGIYDMWTTQLSYFYNGQFDSLASAWFAKNDAWVRSQVALCSSGQSLAADCDYWYQVGLVLAQLDGMVLGYNENCESDMHLTYDVFLYLSIQNDLDDVLSALYPSSYAHKDPTQTLESEHCSVMIKYSPSMQQLYHAHVTWDYYANMLRTFKHYTFPFSHPSTASKTVSFSSSPGFIPSGDDYFITDKGLIVTETTNAVFNMSLYTNVQTDTVMYWIRVVVANRMANNGSQWVEIFAKYNSGTYNNQWQITDTKLFTAGKPIQPGTLYILEQIPGYIEIADVSSYLTANGYFPSYNVPYFPFIYNISGYLARYESYGDKYSYSACPRAKIFSRDHGKVVTFQDMQNIMRYNSYKTDPLSSDNPCSSISARCDLNTTEIPFGGLDCKVTSTSMITGMLTAALSGPTTLTLPPFSWDAFPNVPHHGQPTLYNFSFQQMQPLGL